MKSALEEVEGLYRAVIDDCTAWHPTIQKDLSRDLSHLHSAGLRSGLPFYTITLPNIVKFLQKGLDDGFLSNTRPPFCKAKSRADRRPELFHGLWSMIFDLDGTLRSDPDTTAIASLRQLCLAAKKLNMECEQRYVDLAISEFVGTEMDLPESREDTWGVDHPVWHRCDGHPIWGSVAMDDSQADMFDYIHPVFQSGFDYHWREFSHFVARFSSSMGNLHPAEIKPKHGPGAISDKSDYTKYDHLYWTKRLEHMFPYDSFGAPTIEGFSNYVIYREHSSRLISVPKTQSGPRLIASEPTCHQWIQGGIRQWLEERVRNTILNDSIDFRRQDLSQELALAGSRSGAIATVDLSSASDRLTTRLVEYCFQGNRTLLDALHACRTRCVELPDGSLMSLRKFSTQGSACTFPVQTIVFSLLAVWAIALTRQKYDWASLTMFAKEVRVFGDDIILPNDSYAVLTALLTSCKLKVNESKSYSRGKFRESCGMDAYDGVDVTPAYYRELPGSAPAVMESIIECSNNFFMKGFWHTADYIRRTVAPQDLRKILIKAPGCGAFGLVSFCGMTTAHLRKRWNRYLHQEEIEFLTTKTKVVRNRGKGHGDLLQFFVEEPEPDLPYSAGSVASVKGRKSLTWVNPAYL